MLLCSFIAWAEHLLTLQKSHSKKLKVLPHKTKNMSLYNISKATEGMEASKGVLYFIVSAATQSTKGLLPESLGHTHSFIGSLALILSRCHFLQANSQPSYATSQQIITRAAGKQEKVSQNCVEENCEKQTLSMH